MMFNDVSTFHLSGYVNKQNAWIWGSEKPYAVTKFQRDSPKITVWCGLMCNRAIGPFFFAEETVTATSYLDRLENFAVPQVEDLKPRMVFQQDGAPPHCEKVPR
jgi:hypothetical protein